VSPSSGRVVASSVSRVTTSMPNSLRWFRPRRDLSRHWCLGVGCAALADHLHAVAWPSKFRPHLPEKYDGSSNPSEFLQVYITAITAAGGNYAVMASYFHVALTGPVRTWLMNLTPGSIRFRGELCAQLTANFANAYQQHGVEAHLHAVRQTPGLHLPLHQGTWNNSTYLRCVYYHGFPPGGP
jgi:hypothetical protein